MEQGDRIVLVPLVVLFFLVVPSSSHHPGNTRTGWWLRFATVFLFILKMAGPREDPLAYNGWAKDAAAQVPLDAYEVGSQGKGPGLGRALKRQPIPVGPPPGDPDYEFECPAEAWISLVEACRLEFVKERTAMVQKMLFLAKNSHWTDQLYQEELHLLDVEYGGDFDEPEVSQPPSNPCATCGVDTGSDRMFCDSHDE